MAGSADRKGAAAPRRELTSRAGLQVLLGASDERLVALARAGDEQAFAAIVERYRGPLLRYCMGFLPPAAAEDALQQTFINAYAALTSDAARVPVSLRPWLYRVAHNAALNVARDPQAGLEQLPEALDGVERPDEVVQRRERLRRVVGAVSALPPRQRHVIVRQALGGESFERIATDMGVSSGAIRQLAHRARRTVRDAAAALLPTPLLRLLPWGPNVAESAPAVGGGGALVKVAVAAVVAGAAGGGAVEVSKRDGDRQDRRSASVAQAPDPARAPRIARPAAPPSSLAPAAEQPRGVSDGGRSRRGSSGKGSSGSGSSGSGSSGSGSSGSGSSGSGSSGSGSSGSGSSGSGSSGSGSSGSGSSGSGSSGSGSSGSGSSGSGSSGSGSSELSDIDSSGSSGSGSSGSGSSGSGSSGGDSSDLTDSDSSGSGSSGSGSSGSDSSGSGSSGSGSSGSDD